MTFIQSAQGEYYSLENKISGYIQKYFILNKGFYVQYAKTFHVKSIQGKQYYMQSKKLKNPMVLTSRN